MLCVLLLLFVAWHGIAGLLFAKSCAVAGAVWLHFYLGLADAIWKVYRVFVAHSYCVGSSSDCVRGDGCVQWNRIR